MHGTGAPSDWVQRFSHLVPPGARVLDVACGAGRHSRWLAQRGAQVTGIDRDEQALAPLEGVARTVCADIEGGPWPLPGETFDVVVVTNYLWRPLWPVLLGSLRPHGLLIVETFALGHEKLGRPRNPDFLLAPGELLNVASGLHVLAYEDGLLGAPPRRVQRIAALACADAAPAERGDWPIVAPQNAGPNPG